MQFINIGGLPKFLVTDGVHHLRPGSELEVEVPLLAGGAEVVQEWVKAAVEAHQGQGDLPHLVDQVGKCLVLDDLDSHQEVKQVSEVIGEKA